VQPILIIFAITFIGVIAAGLLFSVAMRGRREEDETKTTTTVPTSTGHFFLDEGAGPETGPHIPSDGLPLQVERHVRLEHEAAEGFARSPNADTLQAPSPSDLKRKNP
jgi:hypothetical protein